MYQINMFQPSIYTMLYIKCISIKNKIKWRKFFLKRKTSKNVDNFNNTIKKFDFIDVYRSLPSVIGKYTLFSGTHRTFTKIDCVSHFLKNWYHTEHIF